MIPALSPDVLRSMPLPWPSGEAGKESRGSVLVIGSSARVPGAALLSGAAALRSGAGKVQVGLPASLANALGMALPEAGIIRLPENRNGDLGTRSSRSLLEAISNSDAVLIGPGMMDERGCAVLTKALLSHSRNGFVLDAGALAHLWSTAKSVQRQNGEAILTPHHGEMARMLGIARDEVERTPEVCAGMAAKYLNAVVVLKGANTIIATPDGQAWENQRGAIGLGTSGSGDILAGLIAGLLARGASAIASALWGVFVHAQIGEVLSARIGPLGFLAREILPEIPDALRRLAAHEFSYGSD